MTDVDTILTAPGLPPLDGADARAERLVLLVHRGVDWDVWGGHRRIGYWDALTDRVKAATYAGPTVSDWWQSISASLSSTPRNPADRIALAHELAAGQDRAVLTSLHRHAAALALRIRIRAEQHRHAATPGDHDA